MRFFEWESGFWYLFLSWFLGGFSGCSGLPDLGAGQRSRFGPRVGRAKPLPSGPREQILEGLADQRPFKVSWLTTFPIFDPTIIGLGTPDITGKMETEQVVWDYGI